MNTSLPYIQDIPGTEGPWLDPIEWSYFTRLNRSEWYTCKTLAQKTAERFTGGEHTDLMRRCGTVEKAGEFTMKHFFDYHLGRRYAEDFLHCDPYVPSFVVDGVRVDVHTRMLRSADRTRDYGTMSGCINVNAFHVMIPEIGIKRGADIYVCCGFDVFSRWGYAFGWLLASELAEMPMVEESRYKAKNIKVPRLHTMTSLREQISNLSS